MNIAVFGGSFDPLHIGHKKAIYKSLETLNIDKLFIVPAYKNPLKDKSIASANQRLKWIQKVFQNEAKIQILDIEIASKKPSYTIHSIKAILNMHKTKPKIYFLIGADNLENIHKWHDIQNLQKLVEFVIINRDGYTITKGKYKIINLHCNISSSYFKQTLDKSVIPDEIQNEVALCYKNKK